MPISSKVSGLTQFPQFPLAIVPPRRPPTVNLDSCATSLSDFNVPPVGLQATPARINAPDSRFSMEQLRTPSLLWPLPALLATRSGIFAPDHGAATRISAISESGF
jgi:hypothetical protein